MQNSSPVADDRHHKLKSQRSLVSRKHAGRSLVALVSLGSLLVLFIQILHSTGAITAGVADWRPILYAYLLWATVFGVGQVAVPGESGLRALFLLPPVLFPLAVVSFPTLFRVYIAFAD